MKDAQDRPRAVGYPGGTFDSVRLTVVGYPDPNFSTSFTSASRPSEKNVPHFDLQEDSRWVPDAYQSGHFAAMSSLLRSV
ncbi:MAG TPA: hypothetical protein VIZ87_10705, partial [Terrimicrobium sp.]